MLALPMMRQWQPSALESSHALAHAEKMAKTMRKDEIILVNLSGRGDKDINTVAKLANITL